MESSGKVRSYLPLVDFLAEVVGPNSEIVLHDLSNEESSLVAIRNGGLSGRDVGAPITDFAKHVLQHGRHEGKNFITNYLGKAGSAGKFLKSSTFFIRDDNDEIIGLLGINTDLSALSEAHRVLGQFLAIDEDINGDSAPSSTNANTNASTNADANDHFSVREMVLSVMEQVLDSYGVDPARMTADEKKEAVEALNKKGIFLLKGVISDVASRLDVSEQTIYRYLK
ncbi:MAG: PAS domain-containing protein [Synergistaceae bacterium]|nr:PAS domain-containing protein [Synergistaceae bacterium]